MIGETGPPQRRKHVISEDKIAGISKVVRDVGLPHLGVREHRTVHVTVHHEVETVHLADVDRLDRIPPTMTKVKWHLSGVRVSGTTSPLDVLPVMAPSAPGKVPK